MALCVVQIHTRTHFNDGGGILPELSEKDIAAINKVLKQSGKTEANVHIEGGKIVVIQIDKKKIN